MPSGTLKTAAEFMRTYSAKEPLSVCQEPPKLRGVVSQSTVCMHDLYSLEPCGAIADLQVLHRRADLDHVASGIATLDCVRRAPIAPSVLMKTEQMDYGMISGKTYLPISGIQSNGVHAKLRDGQQCSQARADWTARTMTSFSARLLTFS